MPEGDLSEPIVVEAQAGNQWRVGVYDVWLLRGNCTIRQGQNLSRCREAVLWINRAEPNESRPHQVIAYLEGDVEMAAGNQPGAPRLTDRTWFGRFASGRSVDVRAGVTAGKPDVLPEIYWRGMARRSPDPVDGSRTSEPSTMRSVASPAAPPTTGASPSNSPLFTAPMSVQTVGGDDPITIQAEAGNHWSLGATSVWILHGAFEIRQGNSVVQGNEAVVWAESGAAAGIREDKVTVYAEGNVLTPANRSPGSRPTPIPAWLGQFSSSKGFHVRTKSPMGGRPEPLPAVYQRGAERRTTLGGGTRRIRAFPRGDVPVQAQWFPDPNSRQWIAVIDSGVNVIVDGLDEYGGTIDISTDRLVIWTTGTQEPDLTGRAKQDRRTPLEFYMEGNVVLRQGERIIYADRVYYDVPNNVGTLLNAEMLTPVREYQGLLRLRAAAIRQTAQDRFFAEEAFITSSRMGMPSYRLQSNSIYVQDSQQPVVDPWTGQPAIDPETGQQAIRHERLATAGSNFVYAGSVPIFYWPRLTADLNDPTFYIRRARMKNDNVYGAQILTNWNGYELLGIRNKPAGTDLDITLDYLGKRGFGHGGSFSYDTEADIFEGPDHLAGLLSYWGIQDQGTDNLGQGRSNLEPEKSYRYRLFWQHRQQLPYDIQLSAEAGWISDRNFLEEYYKGEWENLKDESTGLELKRLSENRSLSLTLDYRIDEFFTQTNWLPRLDHFWLGQPVLNDAFTWYEHTNLGYGQFRKLEPPSNPKDQPFSYLPWEESSREGERLASRQEIDWPLQLGAVKVVPYVMGELARWGEGLDGEPVNRAWGQVGFRASLPTYRIDPTVSSDLLNVRGIAHKITYEFDFSFARTNHHIDELPLYDPLDDDSVEAFRRRFATTTFGWPSTIPPTTAQIPRWFEERYYALRTGLQDWVTSPSTEIADDLTAARLGIEQRWQTKRGSFANPHVIDWITLDTHMTFYPDSTRDNYDMPIGLLDYDWSWHVGDRLTLVSDGIFDFFDEGQKIATFGGFLNRPPRGSLYLGFRVLQGPIDSRVVAMSYSYRMSPKWMSSYSAAIDLSTQGTVNQGFSLTRIGESFLVSGGFSVDLSRETIGFVLTVEPRFTPKGQLGNIGGARVPPAGEFGLE